MSVTRRSFLGSLLAAPVAVPAVAASAPPTIVQQSRISFVGHDRVLETTLFSDGVTTCRVRPRFPGEMFRLGTVSCDELRAHVGGLAKTEHDGAPAAPGSGGTSQSAGAPS